MCLPGDSGAWWLEENSLRAVGLHCAGNRNPSWGLALSMPEVLDALNVDVLTEPKSVRSCRRLLKKTESRKAKAHSKPKARHSEKKSAKSVETPSKMNQPPTEPNEGRQSEIQIAHQLMTQNKPSLCRRMAAHWYQFLVKNSLHMIFSGFMIVMFALSVRFNYDMLHLHHRQAELAKQLQSALIISERMMARDSLRNINMKKIITIVDRYNPRMPTRLKFAIAEEIYEMDLKYENLNIDLICATITHESAHSWNPQVVSHAGALGLMQIMPSTGIYLAREEGVTWNNARHVLFDPITNIRLGCRYLSTLIEAYGVDGGLAAYNGGEARAEKWVRNGRADGILHEETVTYVPSILKIYAQYNRMDNWN